MHVLYQELILMCFTFFEQQTLALARFEHTSFARKNATKQNKPRMAKVGATYKAQNCKRGDPSSFVKLQLVARYEKIGGSPLGLEKNSQKIFENEILEQCNSAEKCKRGDPLGFFDIHCVAKCRNK